MTTQNTAQAMKEVFVVGAKLEINSVQVPVDQWEHQSGYFGTEIDGQPKIALRGGRNKVTTYAGFASRQEAEEFKIMLEKSEARKVRAMRRVIDNLRIKQRHTENQMRTRYCPPEEFSEATRLFRSRFFSALGKLGFTYDDFKKTMVDYEKKEREKTGEHYTSASFQLFWAMGIVEDIKTESVPRMQRVPHR